MAKIREFDELKSQAVDLEKTIQRLQADLYNAYREYQKLSEEAFRHAAESMRDACINQAVSLAEAGAPPEKIRDILSQISIYPSQRDSIQDIHES